MKIEPFKKTMSMKENLISLSESVHFLQRERGFAGLFIQDINTHNQKTLEQYFLDTNKAILNLTTLLKEWKNSKKIAPEQRSLITGILGYLDGLESLRHDIIEQRISLKQVHDYYTFNLVSQIIQLMSDFVSQADKIRTNVLSAFSFFLQWKEKVSLERLSLIQGFVQQNFDNENYQKKIEFILSEQHHYKKSFTALASNEQRKIFRATYNKILVKDVLKDIHDKVLNRQFSDIASYRFSARKWFDLVSEKLDAMHSIEKKLIDNLDNWRNAKSTNTLESLNIEQRLVYKLPIFHQIPNAKIEQIIESGEIYQLPKNKLIVAENNFATHLHIVLMGWVKVFKQLQGKKTTVLHMLGHGDTIMESCIFSNTCLKASAKSTTDVLIFSIPVSVVRSHMNQNNQFILNILSNLAKKTVLLNHELERHKTQTVDARVGYFLLDLLKQKKWLSTTINLPYSKSIIASQLGMSREVFSRSLAGLSKLGFVINNKNISLPNKYALCQYCDNMISESCVHYATQNCIKRKYLS